MSEYHVGRRLEAREIRDVRQNKGLGFARRLGHLCEAQVGSHALLGFVDVPNLDFPVQAPRQQQVPSLGKEPAVI